MDFLEKNLDAESFAILDGLQCHVKGCGQRVKGYVDELKQHFIKEHKLLTSKKSDSPFICTICGCIHLYFKDLKKHIVKEHPRFPTSNLVQETMHDNGDEDVQIGVGQEVQEAVDVEMLNLPNINNPYYFDDEDATLEDS